MGRYGGQDAPGLEAVRWSPPSDLHSRPVAQARNASFAAWSRRHRMLYAIGELTDGVLYALSPMDWSMAASVPTHGAEPCHCALDPAEGFVAIANYRSGNVAVYALDEETGLPLPDPWIFQGSGSGPDVQRQSGPHAHWVGFSADGRWLLQIDLGADCIRAFAFDPKRGVTGEARAAFRAPAGSGPRWLAWLAPDRALLVSELASTLTLLDFRDGAFTEVDRRSTRPADAGGASTGGHVIVGARGGCAYCTNRGDDTVALFRVERDRLELVQTVPSGGHSPRFLCLIKHRDLLLVGHAKSGPVRAFSVLPTGELLPREETIGIDKVAWIAPSPD
ncbi:MAG: lactonase family protein [Tsuneonella sp.]